MKVQAVMILLAIALSIVVPPSLSLTATAHGGQAMLGTLDVCHAATPALASNGDMPCMNEGMCCPLPLAQYKAPEIANPPFQPFFIAFQDERPPKH